MNKRSNLKPASGTSRQDRFPKALDPASAPVDQRTCADLMAFALDFSKLLSFYDSSNQPIANWWSFFARDLSFLLARIVTTDFQQDSFKGWAFQNAVKEGQADIKEILKSIYQLAKRIDDWYLWASEIAIRNRVDNGLRKNLESIIKTDLRFHLAKNIDSILEKLPGKTGKETWTEYWTRRESRLHRIWHVEQTDQSLLVAQYDRPVDALLSVLRAFHMANRKLHDVAKQYLEELLTAHSDHPPHTALYLAFSRLLLLLQEKLNTITGRHLDFYYRDVLKLIERGSSPDVAHVSLNLAPELKSYLLPAGTRLSAGKDPSGKLMEYATDHDLQVNHASVGSAKAVYLSYALTSPADETSKRVSSIFVLPQADSYDGKGEPIKVPERGWPTFGINETTTDGPDVSSLHGELGFVVASPMLLLQEGERNVIVTIAFAGDGALEAVLQGYQAAAAEILDAPATIENLLADAFLIYVSGDKGWIPVKDASFRRHAVVGTTMEIEFTFTHIDPAIVPNAAIAPAGDSGNESPLFKLTLNPYARVYAYTFFHRLEMDTLEFRVSVRGVKKLQVCTEIGPVDPSQPFPVLGPIPTQGSYLLLNHRELNIKPVEHVTMIFTWFNLPKPPDSMESYYAGYRLGVRDDTFKLRISVLGKSGWEAPEEAHDLCPMFAQDFDRSGGLLPVTVIAAQMPEIPLPTVDRPVPLVLSEAEAPRGCVRLELAEPAFGFGHQVFPGIMAETAIKNSKAGKNGPHQPLPNPPLAPISKTVMMDYDAGDKVMLTRPLPASQKTHFYSVHPFGYLAHQGRATTMFPDFKEQGHLYLGISGSGRRQPVTLLFHICDTAFSPVPSLRNHADGPVSSVRWRYLSNQEWKDLPAWLLLSDSTMGLTRSGIVKMSLPEDIGHKSTLMPEGMCWIEAAAPQVVGAYWSRVVSISTQAVSATRVCDLQSELVPAVIPPGAITQLSHKLPQIKAVHQPFASSGGRSREGVTEFRNRVSERLRHKDRAIQGVDFERLVLERFAEVGQVKCIGPNNSRYFPGTVAVEPGSLYLVVTPRLENTTDHEPRLAQHILRRIESYLRSHASIFVKDIHAINPVYETLKIFANVQFSLEGDGAGYSDALDAALSAYLQPWRGGAGQSMRIGSGQVQTYDIASFIQRQTYVTRLHSLSMLHTYQTEDGYASQWASGKQRASASAPWAVLIPAAHHSIVPVDPDDKAGIEEGIRNLTVGGDLVTSWQSEQEKKEDSPELRYFLVVPAHHEHGDLRR